MNFVLQARKATNMGVCKMDVGALEAHQNDRSYVCQFSELSFESLHTNLAWLPSSLASGVGNSIPSSLASGVGNSLSHLPSQVGLVTLYPIFPHKWG